MKSQIRFIVALALLVGTALFLQARNRGEVSRRAAACLVSATAGRWTGTDVEIEKEIRDVLGPGDFMLRVYRNDETRLPATICSSPISPASAPATPFIRPRIACPVPMDAHWIHPVSRLRSAALAVSSQSLRDRQGFRPPARALLVLGA